MKTARTAVIAVLLTTLAAPAFAEGDAAKGKKIFNKCKACHAVGDGAKNKVGPVLTGIVDSPAGLNPDFKYSATLIEAAEAGLVWDTESLSAFLTNPKDFMDGTKMSFAGLRKESDIENIIAYLKSAE